MFSIKPLLICVQCLVVAIISLELPPDIQKCKLTFGNEALSKCLLEVMRTTYPKFEKGFPQLGVEPFQPLKLHNFTVDEGTGLVHVAPHYIDAELYNLARVTLQNVSATLTPNELNIHYTVLLPNLTLAGKYQVNGSILVFPVFGNGDAVINLYDVTTGVILKAAIYDNKGEKYLKFKNVIIDLQPKRAKFEYKNLFNGNKELGDNINNIINENSLAVFDDARKGYEKEIAKVVKNVLNTMMSKIPSKNLFEP